ncbi:IS982 family transposase [Nostoc punctiforme]|uniref:IS982 family transposase n=1 Tax=Nostoc punctiforme TaxID=272131 RepID=UPI003CC8B91C
MFFAYKNWRNSGISFIDSTPINVCHNCRAHAHKVFKGLVKWGKNSVGWHFGFKLHLIINDCGELLAFKLTPANVDDRKPGPDMTKDLIGKLFGDRGYVSQKLFEELYERGVELVTKSKKKMKNRLVKLIDKIGQKFRGLALRIQASFNY